MKKTLSKASIAVRNNVAQFLGIGNNPTSTSEDEPYWIKDEFWTGTDVQYALGGRFLYKLLRLVILVSIVFLIF